MEIKKKSFWTICSMPVKIFVRTTYFIMIYYITSMYTDYKQIIIENNYMKFMNSVICSSNAEINSSVNLADAILYRIFFKSQFYLLANCLIAYNSE